MKTHPFSFFYPTKNVYGECAASSAEKRRGSAPIGAFSAFASSAAALALLAFATFAPAPLAAAPASGAAVAPEDQPGQFLPGDLRKLASFAPNVPLAADFVERGAAQFATLSSDGLVWAPTATNVYTLVLAKRGVPRVVADKTITTEFRLPAGLTSLGLHLHGRDEASPSHLVLVNRTAPDRGLIRIYRTPTWPSGAIAAGDMLPAAQARVVDFPAEAWQRLVVTTETDRVQAQTTVYVQLLSAADNTQLAKLEARDPGLALPEAGLVALRLFGPAGGRVEIRSLVGQPQP